MAQSGFWLRGAKGKYAGAVLQKAAGGRTIMRENVTPANPRTEQQVTQRTKFKLMSQLSSALKNSIAIPRDGALSPRNVFQKLNFPNIVSTDNAALIDYKAVQLTKSQIPFITPYAVRADRIIEVETNDEAPAYIDRVVYIAYARTSNGSLVELESKVVEDRMDGNFPTTFTTDENGDIVIYAYGMIDSNTAATAKYNNMHVVNSRDVAMLYTSNKLSQAEIQLTQTEGAILYSGAPDTTSPAAGTSLVRILNTDGGSVTGGGQYNIGDLVTIVATPQPGYRFKELIVSPNQRITQNPYQFNIPEGGVNISASFERDNTDFYEVSLVVNGVQPGELNNVSYEIDGIGLGNATVDRSVQIAKGQPMKVEIIENFSAVSYEIESIIDAETGAEIGGSTSSLMNFVPTSDMVIQINYRPEA